MIIFLLIQLKPVVLAPCCGPKFSLRSLLRIAQSCLLATLLPLFSLSPLPSAELSSLRRINSCEDEEVKVPAPAKMGSSRLHIIMIVIGNNYFKV